MWLFKFELNVFGDFLQREPLGRLLLLVISHVLLWREGTPRGTSECTHTGKKMGGADAQYFFGPMVFKHEDVVLMDPLKIQYRRRMFQSTLDGCHLKDGARVSVKGINLPIVFKHSPLTITS